MVSKVKIKEWMKPLVSYLNEKGYEKEEEIYNICSNALIYRMVEEIGNISSDASKRKNFNLEDKLEPGKYDYILNQDRIVSRGDPLTTNNIYGDLTIKYKDKLNKTYTPLLNYDLFSAAGAILKIQEVEKSNKDLQNRYMKNLIKKIKDNNFLKDTEKNKETLELALSDEILKLDNGSKIINLILNNLKYGSNKDARYVKRKIHEFPRLQKKVSKNIDEFIKKMEETETKGRFRIKYAGFMENFINYLESKGLSPEEEIKNTLDKLFKKLY